MDQTLPTESAIQSILVVDCGTLHTRAVLFDVVDEEYRFVGGANAPTTVEPPSADLTVGVYNAIAELEATTGRRLVEGGRVTTPQHRDGHGVDVFLATASAAPALRLIVAGLTDAGSIRAATLAAEGTYTHLLDVIGVDDTPASAPNAAPWQVMEVDKLLALSPDAVVLVGGTEGGPLGGLLKLADVLIEAVAEVRRREERAALIGGTVSPPPLVLYAGNSAAAPRIAAALGDSAELVTVPNVQPTFDSAQPGGLQAALADLYRSQALPTLPNFTALETAAHRPVTPTAEAITLVTRYVSAQYRREVLTADVGAATTMLVRAGGPDATQSGVVIRGDYGLATGLTNLLADVGAAAVLRWLPFAYSAAELHEWALNKALRPMLLPQTGRDLAIEHAFAREALRALLHRLHHQPGLNVDSYDLLIGTGGLLANAPRLGQAAMILLDALEPSGAGVGSLELALDSTLLLSAIGALAPVAPGAAAYVFDRDCLLWLGTCIVPLGAPAPASARARKDAPPARTADGAPLAVEVTVEYAGGGGSLKIEVPYGAIEVIPLRPEQKAALTVRPGPGFRIGAGVPGKQVQTGAGEEVKGGLIGLIVDARGRPLHLPTDDAQRQARLLEWGRALRAYGPNEVFTVGMAPLSEPEPAPVGPTAPDLPPAAPPLRVPRLSTTPLILPDVPGDAALPTSPLDMSQLTDAPPGPEGEGGVPLSDSFSPTLPNSPFAPRRRGTSPLNPGQLGENEPPSG